MMQKTTSDVGLIGRANALAGPKSESFNELVLQSISKF